MYNEVAILTMDKADFKSYSQISESLNMIL